MDKTGLGFHRFRYVVAMLPMMLVACAVAGLARPAPTTAAPVIPPERQVWVSSTGQVVGGAFLGYWLMHPEIGDPITGAAFIGNNWTQWFENARIEIDGAPIEAATVDHVRVAPIGRAFAWKMGYTNGLEAFQPEPTGPERFFPDTGHSIQNGFRHAYEQPGVPERLGPPISDEFSVGHTTYQFFEYGAFSWAPDRGVETLDLAPLDASLNGQSTAWQPQPWNVPDFQSSDLIDLSDLMVGERWIEVDLSDYELTAWVGDFPVLKSVISQGPPQAPTPTGEFAIYLKYDMQSLQGIGWNGQPYSAPNTPWVMYFYQDFAIHPSNWRTSFGYGDSQGCVIPPMDVAEKLYAWADYGTRVWVHE